MVPGLWPSGWLELNNDAALIRDVGHAGPAYRHVKGRGDRVTPERPHKATAGGELLHPVVPLVRDVDETRRIDRDTQGGAKLPVTVAAFSPFALEHAGRGEPLHPIQQPVRDVDITVWRH